MVRGMKSFYRDMGFGTRDQGLGIGDSLLESEIVGFDRDRRMREEASFPREVRINSSDSSPVTRVAYPEALIPSPESRVLRSGNK
jgi:hypothetical protein